jgi:hypothetical protein
VLSDILYRIRAVFRRDDVEHELDDELRFHLDREIDKLIASGLSRDDATRRARLAFGGLDQTREACRDARGIVALETVLQDLRYGVRTMKRAPMLSLTAILTIALSTAALATVLTLGYTLFFRRLPVDRPQELVAVAATRLRSDPEGVAVREANRLRVLGRVSYADYLAFRDRTTTLAGLAAHYPTAPLFVSANGNVKEVNGAVVSANFFPLLGIQPALGRFFHDNEDRVPDRDRVAVIGHDFWRTWFASSPAAIGSSMRINGTDFTIVGVAPSTFAGMTSSPMEVYIPTMMLRVGYRWCADALASDCTVLQMIGRLARGRTATDAAADLPALMPASWFHAPLGERLLHRRRGAAARRHPRRHGARSPCRVLREPRGPFERAIRGPSRGIRDSRVARRRIAANHPSGRDRVVDARRRRRDRRARSVARFHGRPRSDVLRNGR